MWLYMSDHGIYSLAFEPHDAENHTGASYLAQLLLAIFALSTRGYNLFLNKEVLEKRVAKGRGFQTYWSLRANRSIYYLRCQAMTAMDMPIPNMSQDKVIWDSIV